MPINITTVLCVQGIMQYKVSLNKYEQPTHNLIFTSGIKNVTYVGLGYKKSTKTYGFLKSTLNGVKLI